MVTLPDHTGHDSGHPVFVVHNGMVAGTLVFGGQRIVDSCWTPIEVETPG